MKLEQCYNYLFQKYNIFSNQKHRDEDNSYIFNHAQIDLWSKRENGDKVDKDEPLNIKKLSNKLRQQLYIYNSCCRRRNGEDLAGKTQTGKIYAGAKKCPPRIFRSVRRRSLIPSGKKLVKQLVSRKVRIWKETERH